MQASAKKEVSCKALEPIFHYARLNNIDLYTLIHDIPYDLPYLLNKRERIEWWVWTKIVSNSRKYFSQSEYEEMGSLFVRRGSYIEGLLWAFFLFTSTKFAKIFYKQIFHLADAMFGCIKQNTEFISENSIRVTAYWEEGYEHCPEWSFISIN